MPDERVRLQQVAEKLRIGHYHRHVLLCLGPDCCSPEVGEAAWNTLKTELNRHGLCSGTGQQVCYRSKVGCLRVCLAGPIAVVYPEGTYYYGLTAERIPEFVQRHLIDNHPIDDWIFARNPLSLSPAMIVEPGSAST